MTEITAAMSCTACFFWEAHPESTQSTGLHTRDVLSSLQKKSATGAVWLTHLCVCSLRMTCILPQASPMAILRPWSQGLMHCPTQSFEQPGCSSNQLLYHRTSHAWTGCRSTHRRLSSLQQHLFIATARWSMSKERQKPPGFWPLAWYCRGSRTQQTGAASAMPLHLCMPCSFALNHASGSLIPVT